MKIRKLISFIILFILIIWAFIYIKNNLKDLKIIFEIPFYYILILIPFGLLAFIFRGLILKDLVKKFNIFLKFKEWFGITIITTMSNYFLPLRGGAGVRAIYLKKKHKLSYPHFLSTLTATYFIIFFINSLLGLLSILLIHFYLKQFNLIIFLIFFILFLFLTSILIFSPKIPKYKNFILRNIYKVINGWYLIKKDKKTVKKIALNSLFNSLTAFISLYFCFLALNININPVGILLISSLASVSILISITPASLGINELAIVFSSTVFGILPVYSLLAALLYRFINIIIVFILGPIYSYKLIK